MTRLTLEGAARFALEGTFKWEEGVPVTLCLDREGYAAYWKYKSPHDDFYKLTREQQTLFLLFLNAATQPHPRKDD